MDRPYTVAIGFPRGRADRDVRVPEEVRVIGFDDIAETAYTVPSLSSTDLDTAGMARQAVDLLATRIGHRRPDVDPPIEYFSSFSVIERESAWVHLDRGQDVIDITFLDDGDEWYRFAERERLLDTHGSGQ